eukprot:1988866-Alexandrium_andersonii.AAC.1
MSATSRHAAIASGPALITAARGMRWRSAGERPAQRAACTRASNPRAAAAKGSSRELARRSA